MIDDEETAQVCFILEFLDEVTIGFTHHAPINEPRVIARRILTIFGEFDGETVVRTTVKSIPKTLHHDASAQFHIRKAIRAALTAVGAKLFFLPPYSPDLNPIEQVFAKLKTLLRKAAERSITATWRRVGALLEHFTPQECANYLANSGYASP